MSVRLGISRSRGIFPDELVQLCVSGHTCLDRRIHGQYEFYQVHF